MRQRLGDWACGRRVNTTWLTLSFCIRLCECSRRPGTHRSIDRIVGIVGLRLGRACVQGDVDSSGVGRSNGSSQVVGSAEPVLNPKRMTPGFVSSGNAVDMACLAIGRLGLNRAYILLMIQFSRFRIVGFFLTQDLRSQDVLGSSWS